MYRVVIVEDEYMIAMLNRSFTERDKRFSVVGEFAEGKKALSYLCNNPVDLLILDVYMPRMTGLELLSALRQAGLHIQVIMVTAAHERETLAECMQQGVVDYLIKPFSPARFQQALDTFCQKQEALQGTGQVNQAEVDKLLYTPPVRPSVPKGLQARTLEHIRAHLSQEEQTCETLAGKVGLSVVTVRRYLQFLLQQEEIQSRMNYDTGGRPSMVYTQEKQTSTPCGQT